ncbi:hypothetical protein [Allokutzneria sp. NRRL B-24872]|uniref:hypothetical protein n=1 Tax=Allokutzneria sp. NRRL B-24872 TaxID=1137961 RepID=UPI001178AC34|nr:hypothetical protein [Allokutzneria sp. NRRL B-24872]
MTSELTGQDRVELDLGAVVGAAHLGVGPGKNHEGKRWPPRFNACVTLVVTSERKPNARRGEVLRPHLEVV